MSCKETRSGPAFDGAPKWAVRCAVHGCCTCEFAHDGLPRKVSLGCPLHGHNDSAREHALGMVAP